MNWKLKLDLWETVDYNNNLDPLISEIAGKIDTLVAKPPVLGYKPIWIVNDLYYGRRIYTPLQDDIYKFGCQREQYFVCSLVAKSTILLPYTQLNLKAMRKPSFRLLLLLTTLYYIVIRLKCQ